MDAQLIQQIRAHLTAIDNRTAEFARATGLACPPGCGRCCLNPHIESTPLELLPLAAAIHDRGEASLWLDRLAAAERDPASTPCACYQPDPLIPGNGRCGVYELRPGICRLFGFAAVQNKYGEPELAACKHHKTAVPESLERAQQAVRQGTPIPLFADALAQLAGLGAEADRERLPINQALRVAIARVGLWRQFGCMADPADPGHGG